MSSFTGTHTEVGRCAEQHYDEVFRYCYRRVSSKEDAQDITQEVFLRFARNKKTYVDRGKPLAYLFTIARNLCADLYRTSGQPCEPLIEDTADPNDDKAELELDILLKNLPEEEQEILELRFDQGLQINEIASAFGVSRFSINRKLNKALKAVEKMMTETKGSR